MSWFTLFLGAAGCLRSVLGVRRYPEEVKVASLVQSDEMGPAGDYVGQEDINQLQGDIDSTFDDLKLTDSFNTVNTAFDTYKEKHVAWWDAVDSSKTAAAQALAVESGTRCTASIDFNVSVPGFACDMTTTDCRVELDNYFSAFTTACNSFPDTVTSGETQACKDALESSWCDSLQTSYSSRWTRAEGICGFGTDLNTFCNKYSTFTAFLQNNITDRWEEMWAQISCTTPDQKNEGQFVIDEDCQAYKDDMSQALDTKVASMSFSFISLPCPVFGGVDLTMPAENEWNSPWDYEWPDHNQCGPSMMQQSAGLSSSEAKRATTFMPTPNPGEEYFPFDECEVWFEHVEENEE